MSSFLPFLLKAVQRKQVWFTPVCELSSVSNKPQRNHRKSSQQTCSASYPLFREVSPSLRTGKRDPQGEHTSLLSFSTCLSAHVPA